MRIVALKARLRVYSQSTCPELTIRQPDGAGDLLDPVDSVGVAGDRRDTRMPFDRDAKCQQELAIAATASLAMYRHRRLTTRQQHARRHHWLGVVGDVAREPGQRSAYMPRLAFEAIAEQTRRDICRSRDLCRRLKRFAWSGDD